MKSLVRVPPRLIGFDRGVHLADACGHAGCKTALNENAIDKTCFGYKMFAEEILRVLLLFSYFLFNANGPLSYCRSTVSWGLGWVF